MRDINQVALKQEATPGTAIALTSADVAFHIRDEDTCRVNGEPIDLQEVQGSSSSRPIGVGTRRFEASLSANLRPSSTPLTTPPFIDLLLKMGMFKREQIKQVAVGAITGGPYVDGEVITVLGVSRGIIFRNAAATPLRYYVTSGAISSGDTIVGATSGASSVSSANPIDQGQLYRLVDSDFVVGPDSLHHTTIRYLTGGFFWEGRGCLGQMAMAFRNGQPVIVRSEVLGAWSNHGDLPLFNVTYAEDAIIPPRWVNASLKLGAYTPQDIVDFSLSVPLNLELREDANDTSDQGVRFADYERRGSPPIVTFDPALVSAATFDFYQTYKGEATFAMEWKIGTKFTFYADECQFVDLGVDKRRSLRTVPLQVRLNGKNNNDLQIYCTT